MKNLVKSPVVPILALIIVYVGFRWVTQAGQGFAAQNDGYAVSGGLFILLGGMVIGTWAALKKK